MKAGQELRPHEEVGWPREEMHDGRGGQGTVKVTASEPIEGTPRSESSRLRS